MKMFKKIINTLLLASLFFTLDTSKLEAVQWASKLIGASSQQSIDRFSANQIIGSPSIMPGFGSSPCAWAPKRQNNLSGEWIRVSFDNPMNVQQISIHENLNPGAVSSIYLYDSAGKGYEVYYNIPKKTANEDGRLFNIIIDRTEYEIYQLKINLETSRVLGWNQIDAIGISDTKDSLTIDINYASTDISEHEPQNLGSRVNSIYSELAPVISPDGKTLYFTRHGDPRNHGGRKDQDVWFSKYVDGHFTEAENMGPPINNRSHNFLISVTPDGNSILLGNIYKKTASNQSGVSRSYFDGENWSFPEKMDIKNFKNDGYHCAFCLGSDGKTLLMNILNDDCYGGYDLFVSFLKDDGTWTEPKNLGTDINTAADEFTPFLASDGKTLYFSSSGHPGLGKKDIFMTKRLDKSWQKWSKPENLGPPLSTPGWDAYFTIPASGDHAYFVSTKNSIGNEDIFRLVLPEALKPEPVVLISGRVLNAKNEKPLKAKIIYEILPEGIEAGIARSNPKTGGYKIVLPGGNKYGFLARADSFVAVNQNLDLRNIKEYREVNKDLYLVPIEHGQKVTMNNIFFEFNEYNLLKDSYPELRRVANFMINNPEINIEIRGHTDSIGTEEYNMELSRKRAKTVADFITKYGVTDSRISVKGYGESKPVAPNNSEENRRKNRRVEFVINKEE